MSKATPSFISPSPPNSTRQVVDLLLGEHRVAMAVMEVNSLNKNGLTVLDALLFFQSEVGDKEIEEILRRAGAIRARNLHAPNQTSFGQNRRPTSPKRDRSPRSPAKQVLEFFKYDKARDPPSEVRNALLVIAVLIATATYQSVLSPPGGVWQDDSLPAAGDDTTTKPHTAGQSVMASKRTPAYALFIFFNSVGFYTSLHTIYILTSGFPLLMELRVAMFALIVTYDASMAAMTPNNSLSLLFTGISIVIPMLIPVVTMGVRNCLKKWSI
ncbi:hypothetical protein U1Q18_037962 [Sarracenia purpurea var. burkii]